MSMRGNLAGEARLSWLRATLRRSGDVRVAEAAAALGVSELTVRRDLQELEALGEVRRVRGGAVGTGPRSFPARRSAGARAKARIAAKLVDLVPETGNVAFDASSTVGRLAATLPPRRGLTVVTNGPDTFSTLQGRPGVDVVLTGGGLDPRTGSLVGPIACRGAGHLLLTALFASCAALDPVVGPSEPCLEEAEVKRALADVAGEVVLAADASKLGRRADATGLPWDRITVLVTDLDPGDARLDPYRSVVELR